MFQPEEDGYNVYIPSWYAFHAKCDLIHDRRRYHWCLQNSKTVYKDKKHKVKVFIIQTTCAISKQMIIFPLTLLFSKLL